MPVSLPFFDRELELYVRHAAHSRMLDIGPGEGKFGTLLKRIQPHARRIAVEIDPSYVDEYRLRDSYDEVLVMDARQLITNVNASFGAVVLGDVIEHLPKSAGRDLLEFLVYRSAVIFVKFPMQMRQNDWLRPDGQVGFADVSLPSRSC